VTILALDFTSNSLTLTDKKHVQSPTSNSLPAVPPQDVAILAHCRRVTATAQAIAAHLLLPAELRQMLRAASMSHHSDEGVVPDVGGQLTDIVRISDAFDQEYESAALGDVSIHDLLPKLRSGVSARRWSGAVQRALEEIGQAQPMGDPHMWRVPTFPDAAVRVLRLLDDPDVSVNQLAEAAGSDPATAASLIRLANSARFGSARAVFTLRDAIVRLGLKTARMVALSISVRPLLAGSSWRALWTHCLEVADLCSLIAADAGIEPGQAYLCGLLHDVGRLMIQLRPGTVSRLAQFQADGVPLRYAETLLIRTDHAIIGATLSEAWHMPAEFTEAIRHHHQPESTPQRLAHLLYLAEELSGGEEDVPSQARHEMVLHSLGLTEEDVKNRRPSKIAEWLAAV
jgi:putative nucleotidyltransferase with HDIG domain